MAFRLADVKKTVRSRSDGERYLHPKLLDGVAVTTQVALALSYFHTRLGRTRGEIDPETLVRFFGDPKVARGLVACLHTAYRWRSRQLGEVLDPPQVARLAAKGIFTPCDLRLYLYDAMNTGSYGGFLPAEREEHLWPLARKLRLTPAKLDQLAALDAPENAVLVRVGAAPEPEHVVALYNFYVVEAILRHSVCVELTGVAAPQRDDLEAACRRHGVAYTWRGDELRLHNQADLFGSYARHGARLTRALFEGAAAAPRLLAHGRAQVRLPGKTAIYLFDRETPRALTGATGAIRAAAAWPELREAWDRHRAAHGTAGWRLQSLPDPLLTPAGLALAPFVARRDETQVLLWPAQDAGALADALALRAAGVEALPVIWPATASELPAQMPAAPADDGAAGVIEALERHWSGGRVPADAQALEGLLHEVGEHGFVPEEAAAEALGCASVDDLAQRLRSLDAEQARYVPGLGLCSPDFAEKMRKGLRRRRPAA